MNKIYNDMIYHKITKGGKEYKITQGELLNELQDIRKYIDLDKYYNIDEINKKIEEVNWGENIELYGSYYLNDKDYKREGGIYYEIKNK